MFDIQAYKQIESFIKHNSKSKTEIVAISKNHPIESVKIAISHGIRVFGENRVQEAGEKFTSLKNEIENLKIHLTGPLQTNKVKQALNIFDVFQTLDREKLAREFKKYPEIIKFKKFFIQINIGREINKSGIYPEEANEFIDYCISDLNLNISGLMCIPPVDEDPGLFFENLKKIGSKNKLYKFSMGMSSDYKKGILSGATHIRVGTLLFGSRT